MSAVVTVLDESEEEEEVDKQSMDGEDDGDDDDDDSHGEVDDDDDYSSVFDSDDEQELAALESIHAQAEQAKARMMEAAQQEWRDLLTSLKTCQTTVLKITDPKMITVVFQPNNDSSSNNNDSSSNDSNNTDIVETRVDALLAATDRQQEQNHDGAAGVTLTHVILSQAFLQRLGLSLQTRFFATLFRQHAVSLAYVRLVADADESAMIGATKVLHYMPNVLHTSAWVTPLSNNTTRPVNVLTEMEIRTLDIGSPATVQQLVLVLQNNQKSLRQVNFLGIHLDDTTLNSTKGLLDPVLDFVTNNMPQLDELRLQVLLALPSDNDENYDDNDNRGRRAHLVTHAALERLLNAKPKWWRLGLDGVGLDDGHVTVLSKVLASSDNCRVGDLLSLTDNPRISDKAMRDLFINVLFNKARMGLVQVAVNGGEQRHQYWEHQFDLVRPLNNVHGRLEAIQNGVYTNPKKWIEWLHKLSELKWLDDAHKINYIWFSLQEKPEMIKQYNK